MAELTRCEVAKRVMCGREILEPAGGVERSICRIRYGRSGIELHRLIFKGIQLGARIH